MPRTFLNVLHTCTHLIVPKILGIVAFTAPISQTGRWRPREINWLVQVHTAVSGGAITQLSQRPDLGEISAIPSVPRLSPGSWVTGLQSQGKGVGESTPQPCQPRATSTLEICHVSPTSLPFHFLVLPPGTAATAIPSALRVPSLDCQA